VNDADDFLDLLRPRTADLPPDRRRHLFTHDLELAPDLLLGPAEAGALATMPLGDRSLDQGAVPQEQGLCRGREVH
jgi:hypothetical protein